MIAVWTQVRAPTEMTYGSQFRRPSFESVLEPAYTPEDRNPWKITISGGIGARGIIPGRPHDRMGVGVYSMLVSEDLNRQPVVGGILGDEVGVEAFYNFAITPSQQLSADAQYIKLGVTLNDDAFVAGTRLFTRF